MKHIGRFAQLLSDALSNSMVSARQIELRLGITTGYISRWKSGNLLPTLDPNSLTSLAELLLIKPEALIDAVMQDRAEQAGVLDYFLEQIEPRQQNHVECRKCQLITVVLQSDL